MFVTMAVMLLCKIDDIHADGPVITFLLYNLYYPFWSCHKK